jgi:D-glycero-D-manno-heptose 1,7-bisphosphate phosphatase
MATLNAIHAKMNRALGELGGRIDAVFFCPHGPDDGCTCRKPLPGLLTTIGERYGVSLRETYAVGDSLRDLEAGVAAGCAPHLVRTGKGALLDDDALRALKKRFPHAVVHADLASFAQQLIQRERQQRGEVDEADSVFIPLER